jgi:ankyrin repeat protein
MDFFKCSLNFSNYYNFTCAGVMMLIDANRYEGNIEALDCHGRTPLFIACAMNREECAEFLVACMDHTAAAEDQLLRKDKRGDTPLHAAACNGAVECLLLLLQHGIDPRGTNDTGLKGIDLAVRNRHKKCKDILAEYHLHYCTSTEFDSVLFLATLQVRICCH